MRHSSGVTRGTNDVDATDREIARYGLLDSPPGRELQALVELAALICGVPTAAINIITGAQQHGIATTGFEPSVCSREDSMCAAVVSDETTVVVPDARLDPRFHLNPFVTGEIGAVRFYASAPLVTHEGVPLGRLCVFDDVPRELDDEQQHALDVVAERMVDVLELRIRSHQLERSLHELTRTRDELHRSNERLSKFAAQVSHDLRTPLTAMLLNTEIVAEDPAVADDEQLRRLLAAAMNAGRRMSGLMDDLLDFAMVGAQLRLQRVGLDALVDEVVLDLRPRITESEAEVDVVGPLGTVTADRQQLYSVFLNLLTNALKFTRQGVTPRVRVRASTGEQQLTIEVTDNGIGIPPDEQGRVFDLFARADRSKPGSGIGLATVRGAVEAHGGSVGTKPAPDGGTTFWFTLPCR